MKNIEIRIVECFAEPAFTELVNAVLHDPDRRVVGERLYGTGGTQPAISGARQVRVGALEGGALIGWSHAWVLPGGILHVGNSGVRPDRRKRGVYTRLVAGLESEARALGCLRVESNHRAGNRAVLIGKLKAGYTIVGTEFSAEMGLS